MASRAIPVFAMGDLSCLPERELCDAGWELRIATSVAEAKALIRKNNFCAGLMLLSVATEQALESIEEILLADKYVEWLALAHPSCLQSTEAGRFVMQHFHDFHTHPVDSVRLKVTLGHAYGKALLKNRLRAEEHRVSAPLIIGSSPAIQELRQDMLKLQGDDSAILITGESGTGKEMVARAIHQLSCRRRAPIVTVNCGAIPATLVQSELFGHEKGAFTGAFRRKIGRFEAAAGGTILLDEIGDLPLQMQVNLLRFLQEKTIQRVASNHSIPVDVRVIAATNVDLEEAVSKGLFREDLFYRLNVMRLRIPPLRARGPDIELLAHAFLERFSLQLGRRVKSFSKQAVRAMHDHPWPGNVRELMNRIRRAVVMGEDRLITATDLGLGSCETPSEVMSLDQARELAELAVIRQSLQRHMNNVSEAARELGVSRVTLYRLINKFQIVQQMR